MPLLKNERHEKFAQLVAKGKSAASAYRSVGYADPTRSAQHGYRLQNKPLIRARIRELSAKTRGRVAVDHLGESMRLGAPTIYREELCELAYKLALLGATEPEIADALSISLSTLIEWRERHRQFAQAIIDGKTTADAEIAHSLYHRAKGWVNKNAVKIFQHEGQPVIVPYEDHHAPETAAASLWLRNRQPHRWRDRQEHDIRGALEYRISQMTPIQRIERLRELQAKAEEILDEQTIEGEAEEVFEDEVLRDISGRGNIGR